MTAALGFVVLMITFWFVGRHFGVADRLGGHIPSTMLSFALLLGPYWAFGFGFAEWLRRILTSVIARALAPALLIFAYLAFTLPRGQFRWSMCLALLAVVLLVSAILTHARSAQPDWHDALVLILIALAVELHFFDAAWPVPGLSGLPKLLFVDVVLYGYLVIRPIGDIGYDLRGRVSDLFVGLREFMYFTPIALALGLLLGFLHVHRTLSNPLAFGSGWIFTLFFIAIPEELFFRGLLLNMLARRIGTRHALWMSAILFGIAHFNKRTTFINWRYVLLASIAGIFYGRAWLARRRVLTSSITHSTVDTVWSILLR
jgi:membrane protease YdiL (CAAX protease family)